MKMTLDITLPDGMHPAHVTLFQETWSTVMLSSTAGDNSASLMHRVTRAFNAQVSPEARLAWKTTSPLRAPEFVRPRDGVGGCQ